MNVVDQVLFYGGQALTLSFLVVCVFKGLSRRFLFLTLYAFGVVACDAARIVYLRWFGAKSPEYSNIYYGSDFCLVVLKYLAILSLFEVLLKNSPLRTTVRTALILFFALASAISYAFITNPNTHFYRKFAVQLQQNIHFAAVVLTALLCLTLARLRVADPRLRMFISGFGVAAALQASVWAIQCLVPKEAFLGPLGFMRYFVPFASCCQFFMWSYSALFVPSLEEVQSADTVTEQTLDRDLGFSALIQAEVRG